MESTGETCLQILMEHLRQRSHTMRSWSDLVKAARNNMKEKRSPLDADDRSQLQQCLEFLHKTADVRTSRELFEHIEELAVQAGLVLAPSPSSPHCRFVMSECFFIEIQAKENGVVDKVFINHGQMGSSKSSSLLVSLINERKWDAVVKHFEGLGAGYNVAGDKPSKIEAFNALQALEQSVEAYVRAKTDRSTVGVVLRSPLGAFRSRAAGRPSRLHFFMTPYDILDPQQKRMREPKIDAIFDNEIGVWGELAMASSNEAVTLQPTFRKDSGSASDSAAKAVTTKLAAIYSLKMSEPAVVSTKTVMEWEAIQSRPTVIKQGNYIQLVQERAGCDCDTFAVALPDQLHTYILDSSQHKHLEAALVSSVEFSDANHLPSVINSLRKEALFAFALKSILREKVHTNAKRARNACHFELTAPRFGQVDCVFESAACNGFNKVSFALDNFDTMSVRLDENNGNLEPVQQTEGSKAFQMSWSIPVTMRTILKELSYCYTNGAKDDDCYPDEDGQTEDEPSGGDQRSGEKEEQRDSDGQRAKDSLDVFAKFDAKATYDTVYRMVCDSMPALVDPQQFHELAGVDLPHRQNLLDIFKQIDVWEALIPPRPGQKPLKSPALQSKMRPVTLPPFHGASTPQQTGPSPIFSAAPATVSPVVGVQSTRSPKARHMSTASDTFEEMNELCNLSKAFAADNDSSVPKTPLGGTCGLPVDSPMVEKAGPLCLERKSSIQDTIDSVLGSAMQPSSCGTPTMAVSPISSFGQADMRHRMSVCSERPTGIIHSSSFEHVDPSSVPAVHHARSFSTTGSGRCSASSTTTINLDVFDFDKSDPMEMGMFEPGVGGSGPLQRWHSYQDESVSQFGLPQGAGPHAPAMAASYAGQCDPQTGAPIGSAVAFQNLNAAARGGRGRGVAGGRRRSRRALNVGDRTVEMALKELKKAERISRGGTATRRPRRPRGSSVISATPSAQIVTSNFGEGNSPKFTLKILQQAAGGNAGMGQMFGGQEAPGMRPPPVQQQGYFPQMQQQHAMQQQSFPMGFRESLPNPPPSGPSCYGGEDSEDATELAKTFPDSSGGDEILRQQIQALRQQIMSNVNFGSLDDRSSDTMTGGMEKAADDDAPSTEQPVGSADPSGAGTVGGNLFENLATAASAGNAQPEFLLGTTAALSSESLMAKLRANVKRRSSLDSVIGKLMADKAAVIAPMEDKSALSEIYEAGENESAPAAKRARLGDAEEQESGMQEDAVVVSGSALMRKEDSGSSPAVRDYGESTPEGSAPSSGEGIKLVIKKSAIKIPGSSAANKQSNSGRNPSGSKKAEKLSLSGGNLKRSSPSVTEWTKGQQQQQGEQKQIALAPSNRGFETLKQKMQEKKMKKQAASKVTGEGGMVIPKSSKADRVKAPKPAVDQQLLAASIDKKPQVAVACTSSEKTPPKSAPATGVPGAEGIVFAKSLKGFKIPKIDESGNTKIVGTSATAVSVPHSTKDTSSRKPPFQPQTTAANMPKPILKHSVSTPAPANLASLIAANSFIPIPSTPSNSSPPVGSRTELSPTFRPYMRRTLLPDPMESVATAGRAAAVFSGPHAAAFDRDAQEGLSVGGAKYRLPLAQSSPDYDGLVIDDNPKSPSSAANTSKEGAAPAGAGLVQAGDPEETGD